MVPQGCPSGTASPSSHSCPCLPAWSPRELSPLPHFPQTTCPRPNIRATATHRAALPPQAGPGELSVRCTRSCLSPQPRLLWTPRTSAPRWGSHSSEGRCHCPGRPVRARWPCRPYVHLLDLGPPLPSFLTCQQQPLPCKGGAQATSWGLCSPRF